MGLEDFDDFVQYTHRSENLADVTGRRDPSDAGDPLTALAVDPSGGESLNFWWHLRLADLIVAPPPAVSQVAQPLDHYYGVIGVEWGALGFRGSPPARPTSPATWRPGSPCTPESSG